MKINEFEKKSKEAIEKIFGVMKISKSVEGSLIQLYYQGLLDGIEMAREIYRDINK